jgi:hypothetical protein
MGDFEFSNSKITSEKSFIILELLLLLLLLIELDDTLRAGIGIDAVVNKGLLIESILSLSFVSLPNELLPKNEDGSEGDCGPFDNGGDNSKRGDGASNFKKLFEELQS